MLQKTWLHWSKPENVAWRKKPQPSKSQMAWSSRSRPELREVEKEIGEHKAVVREREKELRRQESRLNKIVVDDSLAPVASDVKELHAGIRKIRPGPGLVLGSLRTKFERLKRRGVITDGSR